MNVEVGVLGSPCPSGLCGRKATFNLGSPELRSCVKVEVDALGGLPVPNGPWGLCGRTATLNEQQSELRSCEKDEVDVLGSSSLKVCIVSVDVKRR